ncbi:exopolysaccharide biosynthesis protein [Plectonema cf. radiosum LEGE 06105]|uniref:Exopolysaccharide biosynthesis protein n=1 Tax=Plectonema cf. radiosum LEGE 06105 TaxID=945769 RepID=A0A8J7F523_9CYAN|nr:exopolysaccharide biosynthesis protein [Plectonema radiosum]MBE9215387.1 exopolysaccharide biosynthesis protein [Plectonema cf. radiosum LEGE 06105]
MAKLSNELNRFFFEEERTSTVSLEDILELAGERIFGFLFVILALPSALPVPAPGYSIPFGILMFLLAVQLIIGRQLPWLPQKMVNHRIKLLTVQKFVKGGIPWLKRIEAVSRPRLPFVCTTLPGKVIIGIAIGLMSIFMMIPIPGTNTLPAIGILVTGFGLLEDDGAISLGGLTICLIAAILVTSIFAAIIWGGTSILDQIKGVLKR